MDWRTSHDPKRTQTEIEQHADTGDARPGALAVVAGGDFTPGRSRLWLGAALIDDLQVARRAGQRFGLTE